MQVYGTHNSTVNYPSNERSPVSGTMMSGDFESVSASVNTKASSSSLLGMDTSQGSQKMNLDEHFSAKPAHGALDLMDIPLLLPTAHNIDALSKYSEGKFKDLLSEYNIPSPPATIEFDAEGKLVLPPDYAFSYELELAFSEHPEVEKALRSTAALASHYTGIMEGAAFRDEMSTARSQADQDRIVQKYNYLFDDNRPAAQIVLAFLDDGSMLLGQSGA